MDHRLSERDRQLAEEFLCDLLFQATNAVQMNLLVDILLGMQCVLTETKRGEAAREALRPECRFEILKLSSQGAISVGTVRGAENAQRVLTCLNGAKERPYFLYEKT